MTVADDARPVSPGSAHAQPARARGAPPGWARAVVGAAVLAGAVIWALALEGSGAAAMWDPAFHYVVVTSLAAALVVLAFGTPLARPALWFSLMVVGFATGLQLIEAGPIVRYDHWRPALGESATFDGRLLAGLAAQAILVAAGLRPHVRGVVRWLRQHLGIAPSLVVLALMIGLATTPMRILPRFAADLGLSVAMMLVQLGNLYLVVAALPPAALRRTAARVHAVFDAIRPDAPASQRAGLDRFTVLTAAAVMAVTALLAFFVWDAHPHVPDEMAYVYQARYLAEGRLAAGPVRVPEAFPVYLVPCDTVRCHGVFPPGWPGMLAAGTRFGANWLVNPLLAGVNVLLLHLVLSGIYGRGIARLGTVLYAASPWVLFLGMSFMSHTATLTWALLAALGVVRVWRGGGPGWLLLAGAGAGAVSLIRPLDGLIVATVAGLMLLVTAPRPRALVHAAVFAVATAATGALAMPYNAAVTGEPGAIPVMKYMNEYFGAGTNELGFGAQRGVGDRWEGLDAKVGHTPVEAVVNTQLNAAATQRELFGWPVGSLLPILVLAVAGGLRRHDTWAVLGIATVAGAYSLYWFAGGPDFGARYWFLAVLPLLALSARGLDHLARALTTDGMPGWGRIGPAALALVALTILVYLPWRALDRYRGYWGTDGEIRRIVRDGELGNAIVLVRGKDQPDYAAAFVYNPLDPEAGDAPLFAYDAGPGIEERIREAYPDRPILLLDGPVRTGSSYRWVTVPGPVDR